MASKDSLIPHILLPLPNLAEVQKPPSNEKRLELIISNLEKHHNSVKTSIVQAAKAKRKRDLTRVEHRIKATDIDPTPARTFPAQDAAMIHMLASLNTPYRESMGDPYLRPDIGIPPPPPGTRPATPPPHMQLAKEALDQIKLYDKHTGRTKKFYKSALDRERRRTSTGGSGSHGPWNVSRTSSLSASGAKMSPGGDPRRQHQSPRDSPRISAAPYDTSRDPRLQRR